MTQRLLSLQRDTGRPKQREHGFLSNSRVKTLPTGSARLGLVSISTQLRTSKRRHDQFCPHFMTERLTDGSPKLFLFLFFLHASFLVLQNLDKHRTANRRFLFFRVFNFCQFLLLSNFILPPFWVIRRLRRFSPLLTRRQNYGNEAKTNRASDKRKREIRRRKIGTQKNGLWGGRQLLRSSRESIWKERSFNSIFLRQFKLN